MLSKRETARKSQNIGFYVKMLNLKILIMLAIFDKTSQNVIYKVMENNVLEKFKKIKGLIGNTPLVEILFEYKGKQRKVYAKLEWYNLTGSIKDRVAYQIMLDAYKSGAIDERSTVYELTSGNMGISIAGMCNLLGNKCEIIMPKSMSEERKKLIELYGARLVLVDDFLSGYALCDELEKQGKFLAHQFENKSNYYAHYHTTGKEIFEKLKHKKVEAFVAGVGTSGTLMGVGKFLKKWKKAKVIGIEPDTARILTGKKPLAKHKIQGLSDERLPKLYDSKVVDEIIQIGSDDAIKMSQKLCKELSLGVGISSGANFLGAVLSNKTCVTTFADDNKKYLSTDLARQVESKLVDQIKLISCKVI
mgnify:CR=1 FL=1